LKLLQLNTVVNSGSTGRIAEEIGLATLKERHESYIAAAYTSRPSQSKVIRIGSDIDRKLHGLKTRLLDRHGFGSSIATRHLVNSIDEINPDIVHLHNIHGYYLNIEILFNYLKNLKAPVVWTLHDCWPFTGHCSHFERVGCYKWQTQCHHCPNKKGYPASWLIDNSKKNYIDKRVLFTGLSNLTIVTPSHWLANHVTNSFLKSYPLQVIHNGINLDLFKPCDDEGVRKKNKLEEHKIILGVASTWKKRKALEDFVKLSLLLKPNERIILVGMSSRQSGNLPSNIIPINRTENTEELAALYSAASVFVNPTYADNFPSTNIEALACGTPVITYNTGGSPEAIGKGTGFVIEKGDITGLYQAINEVLKNGKSHYSQSCRERAEQYFDKEKQFRHYLDLYKDMLKS
jgi:glycosyltransferase involved in cell wall biosynthesis